MWPRSRSWLAGAGLLALLVTEACHPAYTMPSLAEPHATLKTRVVYHDTPGTQLEQQLLINGNSLPVPPPVTLPGEIARAIPIRLEGARLDVRTAFYHLITVIQTRSESYQCGYTTYSCGTSTCSRANYCTRMVTVPVTTRVTDAACAQSAGLGPQQDAVYLLQYDYFANGRCTLACLREWPQPDGTFRNTACEAPPAQ